MSNPKEIKAIDGFSRVADGDVVSRATNIQVAMTGNGNFPNSPVDMAALKTAIETFSALIAEALDGSKKVIAQKNKQRAAENFRSSSMLCWLKHFGMLRGYEALIELWVIERSTGRLRSIPTGGKIPRMLSRPCS